MAALLLTALVGIGGFAVDVGNWYLHISRLQRAADAAALAGSVYLPGDNTKAIQVARELIDKNSLSTSIKVIGPHPSHPTRLRVELTEHVDNYFLSILGFESIDLTRVAVGEYHPYIPMGSPSNVLGVEVPQYNAWEKPSAVGMQSHYWLNISSAGNDKSTGDRFSSGKCSGGTDNCTGSAPPLQNADFSPSGQSYVVRIRDGVAGRLAIEAFDPGFAYVGDLCNASTITTSNTAYSATNTAVTTWGANNPACTGDQMQNTSATPPDITFQLYTPEQSAGGSQPIAIAGCNPTNGAGFYPGYKGNIMSKYNSDATFRSYFRNWSRVCTIDIGGVFASGDYILRVSNGTSSARDGLNRFALRAGFLSPGNVVDTSKTSKISLFSQGRLVIYAKDSNADATFYIARILPSAKGQTLVVTLFDIGDAADGANLSFAPPLDATTNGGPMTSFATCRYTKPGSTTYISMEPGCTITGMYSTATGKFPVGFNGRIVHLKVTLPSDYSCDESSAEGCWTRLKLHYNSGNVTDTTSWQAALDANPSHLVPDND